MGSGRRWIALATLAVVGVASSVSTHLWLFPLYSANRDDSVYVAMSRLIQTGHVTLPAAGQEFFRPWASGVLGDRIVLKYTPPWPSVLAAADTLTGSTVIGLGLTAAATVVVMAVFAGEVLRDHTAGVVAGVLFALSPVFVVQSATYLPYVFELFLTLSFATLLLIGVRRRSSARLVAAGAVWGVAAFARPYDAVLVAAPFVLVVLVDAWRGRSSRKGEGWTWLGTLLRLAAGAVPLLIVSLVYNAVVMGSPFRLPYTATGPQDGLGFGRRGVFPQYTIAFEPGDGLTGLLANLRWTPTWVFGGIVLVALAVVGLLRSTGSARWAVAGLAVVYPLGYLPFWAPYAISQLWAGAETFGPFYYLPIVVPLATFAAVPLVALWRGGPGRDTRPREAGSRRARWRAPGLATALAAVLVITMVALTAVALPDKVAANVSIRDDYRAVRQFVDDQDLDTAVLLLPRRGDLGFVSSTPFLENDLSLRQPVLYAEDRGPEDFELVDRYPDRALYRLSEDLPAGETTGGRLTMDRLRVDAGPAVVVRLRLTNQTDRTVVVAYLTDGHRVWSQPLDPSSARGSSYDVSWTVAAPRAEVPSTDGVVRLPAGRDDGMVAVGLELRTAGQEAGDRGIRWERRMVYRLVNGAEGVELLRPGQGWAHDDAPGATWLQSATDNPVVDTGS